MPFCGRAPPHARSRRAAAGSSARQPIVGVAQRSSGRKPLRPPNAAVYGLGGEPAAWRGVDVQLPEPQKVERVFFGERAGGDELEHASAVVLGSREPSGGARIALRVAAPETR